MSLFLTRRSPARSSLRHDPSAERPAPSLTDADDVDDAEPSLPRHLLVTLAGITADVTSLRDSGSHAPQAQATLAALVGRLDGLVDSIYQHAGGRTAPSERRDRR